MNVIVVGCGKIGAAIISSLSAEGHNLIAMDTDRAALSEVTNVYDVMGVCGNGADCETLMEAEVAKAELLIAVTGSDEFNMLSCFLAKRLGAKNTIARIRNPEYNDQSLGFMKDQLDISITINPEKLAAEALFNILKLPSAVKVEPFARRKLELIELRVKEGTVLDGIRVCDLRDKYKENFLVCVVKRGENVYIPDGSFTLQTGDRIGITATPIEIHKLLNSMGVLRRGAKNVMILGASRTAYYLAAMLIAAGNQVKIIDRSKEQCRRFSEALPKATLIYGDGTHQELLLEEGLQDIDAFVSLTGMDEENILVSIFASSQNVPKVISKINRDELAAMAENLGLDSIISPHKTISDVLVRYARALKNSLGSSVETLYKLMDGEAEAVEFTVIDDSRIVNIPLSNLKLQKSVLIAGIIRGRKTFIPSGNDCIMAGDRVVVISQNRKLNDISDILK